MKIRHSRDMSFEPYPLEPCHFEPGVNGGNHHIMKPGREICAISNSPELGQLPIPQISRPCYFYSELLLVYRAYNDILLGTLIIKLQKINVITIFYLPQVGYSK